MTKKEYLDALEKELQALPYDEQKEALEYYQNYFDDAGLENEQAVIQELGTVEELGAHIRSNFTCVPAKIATTKHSDTKSYEYTLQEVKSLNINISAAWLKIRHGEELSVRIENTDRSRIYSKLESDGTLKISTKPYIVFGFINLKVPKVFITLPKKIHFESVRIKTSAGSINGKNLDISTNKSNFSVGAGSIKLSGITSGKTNMDCNAGEIALSGTFTGQTKMSCSIGSIELRTTGNMEQWSYVGESKLGSIRINNTNISGLGRQNSGAQRSNHFDIGCNMGSVDIRID